MEKVRRKIRVRRERPKVTPEIWGVGIFILLVILAPLAFGAVDRVVQIGLLLLLGIGIWISPPAIVRPGRTANAVILTSLAVLLVKEFGPSLLFGSSAWRKTLAESYGVLFPWTHNPEPSRALDGLLAGIVAVVWFLWSRTLAVDRARRTVMIWGMLVSAALVSIVSFATRGMDAEAIYGMRYTPGWFGFGPFPNRNHTASFLAMGVVLGAGCVGWAGARKNFKLLGCAVTLSIIAFAGLLATQSRGGIVVLAAGLGVFVVMVLCRFPSLRTIAIVAGAVLMVGAVGLAFGAQVIGRFASREGGEVSNLMRVHIWQDTLRVWKDAPLLGHGLGTFPQIFPMYQQVATGESIVLHPESSWLQWLVELGALPVLFGACAALVYIGPRVRVVYAANRSIFLRAGPFAAAAVLLIHAAFDVPAHRWGTTGFGLAALAIACAPTALAAGFIPATRRAALVPAGIALFWMLPLVADSPAWSPLSLTRLLAREQTTPFVSATELERSLRFFPLNPTLHYSIGLHQIDDPQGRHTADWQRHFRIAVRLMPTSWELPAMLARACPRVAPGIALHYWQVAVERAGHRSEEVLGIAMQETVRLRGASGAWEQYARAHPELLLTFARNVPESKSRQAFAWWWEDRASAAADLTEAEVNAFYSLVEQRGTREQFDQFRERYASRRPRDFHAWVNLLHKWGDDSAAWRVLEPEWPEPAPRSAAKFGDPVKIASLWEADPYDAVNAREYAEYLASIGDMDRAADVILKVAERSRAANWFVRKAAHLRAQKGDPTAAIALFLSQKDAPGDGR